MIVGTAGHIDHGKTSLVRAITGIETDRLKEEKARGITIELGFAYWPRPAAAGSRASDAIIGFVDMPGHERLVHTMLAGASGIDFVLLAVAADDGVMPQTREHLAIIQLLGLQRGIVALTKCDLADTERRAVVTSQIRNLIAGTALAQAPILPVSSATGEGLDDLKARLDLALLETGKRDVREQRYRQAIDRVFSLAGAGTVATGTIMSGSVRVGDQVAVSPKGLTARVRSIHAQGRQAPAAQAGERAAIALAGPDISTETITRGDVILDPTLHAPVRRFDARLDILATERKPFGQWAAVHLYHGATMVQSHIVPLGVPAIAPGCSALAQLVLQSTLAAAVGDRFVLRDVAETRTIGGGTILDLTPPERRRQSPERLAELSALAGPAPRDVLMALLNGPRGWVDLTAFFRDRALAVGSGEEAARDLGLVTFPTGPLLAAMTAGRFDTYREHALARLADQHATHPELPGLGQEKLRLALLPRLPAPVFTAILGKLQGDGDIRLDRAWVRLPGHEVRLSVDEERLWQQLLPGLAGTARFRPPRVRDMAKASGVDEAYVRRLCKLGAQRGDVDEIAQDHFFLAATVVEMAEIARALAANAEDGRFSVIQFRDQLDNGRKVAIQILEFFDAQGLTMRRGDWRRINPHKAELFRPVATVPTLVLT